MWALLNIFTRRSCKISTPLCQIYRTRTTQFLVGNRYTFRDLAEIDTSGYRLYLFEGALTHYIYTPWSKASSCSKSSNCMNWFSCSSCGLKGCSRKCSRTETQNIHSWGYFILISVIEVEENVSWEKDIWPCKLTVGDRAAKADSGPCLQLMPWLSITKFPTGFHVLCYYSGIHI